MRSHDSSRWRSRLARSAGARGAGQGRARRRRRCPRSPIPPIPKLAGQGSVRPRHDADRGAGALDRLLFARLSGRRRSRCRSTATTWQVMRLSRNRAWGHPAMIAFLERFSRKAAHEGVWPGILVGDISQPRGGPMLTGHASHQIGLDADVWLTPMPDHRLDRAEREEMSAVDMVRPDGLAVDPAHWSAAAGRGHQGGRGGARGRAHLRQRGDQEGAVRDAQGRSVDEQGARPIGATTIISTSASSARPARRRASRRTRFRPATAATSRSTGGSPTKRCIPRPASPSRR